MIRRKPRFTRENAHRKKRVSHKSWRYPRGMDSKQSMGIRSCGPCPEPGYGGYKKLRTECKIIVANVNDLLKLGKDVKAVKIGRTVGKRKRQMIIKKADEMKIRILNR